MKDSARQSPAPSNRRGDALTTGKAGALAALAVAGVGGAAVGLWDARWAGLGAAAIALALAYVVDRGERRRRDLQQAAGLAAQVDATLREDMARYQRLVEANIIGILFWDVHGLVTEANDAFLSLIGYSRAEMEAGLVNHATITPQDWAPATQATLDDLARRGVSVPIEKEYLHKNGTRLRVLRGSALLKDGRHDGVSFVLDITARRKAEDALAAAHAELEQRVQDRTHELELLNAELSAAKDQAEAANIAKSSFLANVSHEIRTPLTALCGYAELLEGEHLTAAQRRHHIHTIRRNSEHLMRVIDDILDLSQIEAGRLQLHHGVVRPRLLCDEVVDLMAVRAREKGLSIRVRSGPGLPDCVRSDATRLRQILLNLVGNAIKFTEHGRVDLAVSWLSDNAGLPTLSVAVTDTGAGIAAEDHVRLFRPFSQLDDSLTRSHSGSGLGLAISRRLAVLLGGVLEVSSEPGTGSTFTLRVPGPACTPEDLAAELAEQTQAAVPRTVLKPQTQITRTVLLVEDNIDTQVLLAAWLRAAGVGVTVAPNGRVAIDIALEARDKGKTFDLILMDMGLPELDGYLATAALRADGWNQPIVALTAHGMVGDRERCLQAGCDDYVVKPVLQPALLATIERHIGAQPAPP